MGAGRGHLLPAGGEGGGWGGREGANHLPNWKHLQVAQIFTKQSKRNRGHTIN